MIPTDDILESLDLSRAQPGSGFLEALFLRFNARVPFENASKILRDRRIADPQQKPRTPEIFWAEHLELGTGGTCFARVAAFDALLEALGFRTHRLLGRVERDFDHAGLAVVTPSGETLADVGFPLPALVAPGVETLETAGAELRIESTPRGTAVSWVDGVPEGPRALELFSDTVPADRFAEHWKRTFDRPSRFLTRISLRRDLENRVISYADGHVRVDDRHSRLRIPLPRAVAAERLSELFGIERELLERAFEAVREPSPSSETEPSEATLTAYLEIVATPESAFAGIATAPGYRRLVEGMASVVSEEQTPDGFRFSLAPPGAPASAATVDTVSVSPSGSAPRVHVERRAGSSVSRSSYSAQRRGAKTYLIREAALPSAPQDLLRNDSLRGRLAGSLALDLLAWARML